MNSAAREPHDVVFLFDVDNTLLDNDRIQADLYNRLELDFGRKNRELYVEIFEQLRSELGYADYLGALQRYRLQDMHDPRVLQISSFLVDYPFADRLYPKALEVLAYCKQWGPVVILSDGDVVFQPHKVQKSGLWKAVDGNVLIYIHKEQELAHVEHRYPARHYVMVDDKLRILEAMKKIWKERLTTVFPEQGHYAVDPEQLAKYPMANVRLKAIGDLLKLDRAALLV